MVQVQLGNEPSSVVAVAGLSDTTLTRFVQCGGGAQVEAFKKSRNSMLQFMYLARGAARYEKDPKVALDYIEKAKSEAEASRDTLGALAKLADVDLTRSVRARAPAEDAIVFTPRESPKGGGVVLLP